MLERYPITAAELRPSGLVAITHPIAMKDRPWYADWFIEKWDSNDLVLAHDELDPIGPTVVDGDEIVNESGEEDDDGWDWLRILIALVLGASENADDIVYNSVYDGEGADNAPSWREPWPTWCKSWRGCCLESIGAPSSVRAAIWPRVAANAQRSASVASRPVRRGLPRARQAPAASRPVRRGLPRASRGPRR